MNTVDVITVQPTELHDWWEHVADDLDECRAHDKEQTWREDIYVSLRAGQATLIVGLIEGRYQGMMVVTRHQDQWQPKRHWLHVWYANAHHPGVLEAGVQHLDAMAKQSGAEMITFRADRKAFERWGGKLGFEFGEIELRREVRHG